MSPSWIESLKSLKHPRVITLLFLGFSAGLPILLIFSSLSLWLREAGVERSAVTFFSWAALGYSFKFVWAPLVDQLPLPWLTKKLGRRRSWLLLAQISVISAIVWMALTDPSTSTAALTTMAMAAVMLGFSSATQDIVIDAYRIESAPPEFQAMLSASYIAGYRIGMLVAGAGALALADWFGSSREAYSFSAWSLAYLSMAGFMGIGLLTTVLIPEPAFKGSDKRYALNDYLGLIGLFVLAASVFVASFFISSDAVAALKQQAIDAFGNAPLFKLLIETLRLFIALGLAIIAAKMLLASGLVKRQIATQAYVEPVRDFFARYGAQMAWLLLLLVGIYRISDIVLGVISNVFYQDLGFSKTEIATVVKSFGLFMTIFGGFFGGFLALRFGVMKILFTGAVLAAGTNLLFWMLASIGHDITWLYIVIAADNLAAGLASAAFVAFLSSLTNIAFTTVQYAIFSSLMTLLPKMIGGYSGSMVDSMGYPAFFIVTTVLGIPALILIAFLSRHVELSVPKVNA